MAQFLAPEPTHDASPSWSFWPVDKVILPYYIAATLAILWFWNRLPEPAWLLAWHVAAIALALFAIRSSGRASWIFRHWYPLPYVAWCYREMAVLMPRLRGWEADAELAHLDYRFWGAHPAVWLERISTPILTEYLQIVYTLFVPAVSVDRISTVAAGTLRRFPLLCISDRPRLSGVLRRLCAGACARPALFPAQPPNHRSAGLWVTRVLQLTLDKLESKAWDCFPSGHTELTILACWGSRLISNGYFGSTSPIPCPSFLLQFIFDTITPSTCWPGPPWPVFWCCSHRRYTES